jgi:predicted DNA-binding protein (MmcQ/YjbR family)
VSTICLALPEATRETESRHATFRVKKKVFAYFLDNHHRDGIISTCVRVPMKEQLRLVATEPKRYYSPAYIGPKGWLGIRVDGPARKVDWKDVEARLRASYATIAPIKGTPSAKRSSRRRA